jgi:hypothetical protein
MKSFLILTVSLSAINLYALDEMQLRKNDKTELYDGNQKVLIADAEWGPMPPHRPIDNIPPYPNTTTFMTKNVPQHIYASPAELKSKLSQTSKEHLDMSIIQAQVYQYNKIFKILHKNIDSLSIYPNVKKLSIQLHKELVVLQEKFLNHQDTVKTHDKIIKLIDKINKKTNNEFAATLNQFKIVIGNFKKDPSSAKYLNQNELQNTQNLSLGSDLMGWMNEYNDWNNPFD